MGFYIEENISPDRQLSWEWNYLMRIMEPLKEMFNPAFYTGLANNIKQVYKPFSSEKFLKQAVAPLASLSLNERMRHTSVVLHQYLPSDYRTSITILKETIPLLKRGYTNLVFPDFVSQYGTHNINTSLSTDIIAQASLTRFNTSLCFDNVGKFLAEHDIDFINGDPPISWM